ncbi:MAG: malate synthase G, partial [Pseudomonadota bacterium]
PQLVVPASNARYAINAANARWGSLYDALYGTDAVLPSIGPGPYDRTRGEQVIQWARFFLDQFWPLMRGSHGNVTQYKVSNECLHAKCEGEWVELKSRVAFVGFTGAPEDPTSILLGHNGLHVRILIDRKGRNGRTDSAGIEDVYLEAALTTIVDFEDSVAAVDGEDKADCYRNWLGLMRGTLSAEFVKDGKKRTRTLAPDLDFVSANGVKSNLMGQSRLLVRNVGHLMRTPSVLDRNGDEVFEGLLDALITSLIALHGLKEKRLRSIYIVKPKMHGPEEAAFASAVFDQVEDILGLSRNTVKIGLMDEERRTSANLRACIYELRDRIIFINTGFLDRTGDEIYTALSAGAVVGKAEMAKQPWFLTYEVGNVRGGLDAGFLGKAQIGKGMWAKPDFMGEMLTQKIVHPEAGADCAWVPSPAAATLHAIHYHSVVVDDVQKDILANSRNDELAKTSLLTPPIHKGRNWAENEISEEVQNACQGILGYVVRWIDQGVGCSKVPDINDVGLMEDRATLRISCQLLGNWMHHGICSKEMIEDSLAQMAAVVDRQNQSDPLYLPMSLCCEDNIAFQTARDLVFEATRQPSGYTEPILHRRRIERKKQFKLQPSELRRDMK